MALVDLSMLKFVTALVNFATLIGRPFAMRLSSVLVRLGAKKYKKFQLIELCNTMSFKVQAKKTAICLAIASASAPGFAELQLLDEGALKDIRGQAGLTIDIETKHTIGEFEYVDAGSLFIRDISFGGIDGGLADNLRAKVDISGPNERLQKGFSDYVFWSELGFIDPNDADVAWATAKYKDQTTGQIGEVLGDGDLLIHVSATDFGYNSPEGLTKNTPSDYENNLEMMKNAIDLKFTQGELGLKSSDGSQETVLTRNLSIEAYLGYLDIMITNDGNGFSQTDEEGEPDGIRLGDSHIAIDVKFRVEDLDVDSTNNATNTFIDRNVTNPYLTLRDMRIHNERGADTLGSFGFASVQQKIAAATDIIPTYSDLSSVAANGTAEIKNYGVDGVSIYDINVRWDWDLPHIQFGDTDTSIGEVYFTDFVIQSTSLTISAH